MRGGKRHDSEHILSTYSLELNLIEILRRKVNYEQLPLTPYGSFQSLSHYVQKMLSGYGRIPDFLYKHLQQAH